jgi:hypothetical protein
MGRRRTTEPRTLRRRSLYCTAIIALLLLIGQHALRFPHYPLMDAQLGLPPLSERWFNPTSSELRIWISHWGDKRPSYLLRLWTSWGGAAEGELVEISRDGSDLRTRRLTVSRAWPAVLHDLDRHAVWEMYEPVPTVLCVSDSTMTVEANQFGQYHRVDVATIANYTDPKAARNVEAIFDYVEGLAVESAQTASLAAPASLHC